MESKSVRAKDNPYGSHSGKAEKPACNDGKGNNAGYLQKRHADPYRGKNDMGQDIIPGK